MKKFESKEAFIQTLGKYISKDTITNGAVTPLALSDYFDENTIEYTECDNSLFLIKKKPFHDYLTFYIPSETEKISFDAVRETSCEILYKNTDSALFGCVDILKNSGFELAFTRNRMVRNRLGIEKCQYEFANSADAGEVYDLLYSSFSYLTGCLPDMEKVKSDISKNRFIVLKNGEEITALIHFETGKRFADIKHMAVKEEYRGQGLTDKLLNAFISETEDKTQRVWVRSDYIQPVKAYTKHGFVNDGVHSAVLIKK